MTAETTEIRKAKGLRLSTSETTTALDTGTIVLMAADEARTAAETIRARLGDLRQLIYEFDQREGWRALGFDSFRSWAVAEIDQASIRHVYRLLAAAETEAALGVTIGHTPESHLRPLAQLDEPDQQAAWERANELAGDGPRQAAHVAQAVREITGAGADQQAGIGAQLDKIRVAIMGGPHRWLEANSLIAALPIDLANDWLFNLEQARNADSALRQRLAHSAASYCDTIKDDELRRSMTEICKGAARELGLNWPEYHDNPNWLESHAPPARPTPAAPVVSVVCKTCGIPAHDGVYYTNDCTGCYHLRQAQTRTASDPAWHLAQARKAAERWTDEARRSERLDLIAALEAELASRLADQPQQEVIEAPADDILERSVLQKHAESTLAGLLQRVNRTELRLLHCLIVGIEEAWPDDDEGISEDVWEFGTQQLAEQAMNDLRWIEAAK